MSIINLRRAQLTEDQAAARERDERVAAYIEARKLANDQPTYRLIVKANGENDAFTFVVAHGFTPGEIARLGDLNQFRVDVHCDDDSKLRAWFVEANLDTSNAALHRYVDGTLLMFSVLNRDSDGQVVAA